MPSKHGDHMLVLSLKKEKNDDKFDFMTKTSPQRLFLDDEDDDELLKKPV